MQRWKCEAKFSIVNSVDCLAHLSNHASTLGNYCTYDGSIQSNGIHDVSTQSYCTDSVLTQSY
jgi:hypothetical protein